MENQSSIKLKSIDVWHSNSATSKSGWLSGIQVHLSNGQSSTQFLCTGGTKTPVSTLEFDSDVRKYDFGSVNSPITAICLYKENGDMIKDW